MSYEYDNNGGFRKSDDNGNKDEIVSWVIIAIAFAVAWPVGLFLLISKLSDSKKKKPANNVEQYYTASGTEQNNSYTEANLNDKNTSGEYKAQTKASAKAQSKAQTAAKKITKTPRYSTKGVKAMRIIGIVLTAIGVLTMLDTAGDLSLYEQMWDFAGDMFFGMGFLGGGLGLLLGSRSMKRRQRRFAKYMTCAGERETLDINELAVAAGVSEAKAERDMELMVEKGLWGSEAYVDAGRDMLFRSRSAAAEYFRRKEQVKTEAGTVPDQAEEGFSGMLRNIRRANDRIADPVLSEKIDRLESITARIFKTIEGSPEKTEKARTFLNYYLPTTQKLLDSYADFEEAGVSGENLTQAKERIAQTMDNIIAGFEHQLDELYRAEAMDIDSDIKVMETMLRRDTGKVSDDFGFTGGTAVQEEETE